MTCSLCGFEWCWLCRGTYTQDHFKAYNPFGCPGQLYSNEKVPRYKRVLRAIGLSLVILLFGPIFLVFALPCYCAFYFSMIPYFVCKNNCFFALLCILILPFIGFALGLGANALFIPFTILVVLPVIIVKNCKKKLELDRNSAERIRDI